MLETPHVAVGAAIASQIPNPWLALPLAFASHFVLERVPHWNPHLNTETKKYGRPTKQSTKIVFVDVVASLAIGIFASSRVLPDSGHSTTILFACLLSVLPDVIEGPYFFLGLRSNLIKRWIKFQKSLQVDTSPLPGLLTQAATVSTALYLILTS